MKNYIVLACQRDPRLGGHGRGLALSLSRGSQLTPHVLREIVAKLKTSKSCSRADRMTAEVLQALPEEAFDILAELL